MGRKGAPEYLNKLADKSEEMARKYEWYGRFSWGYSGLFGGIMITTLACTYCGSLYSVELLRKSLHYLCGNRPINH